MRMHVLAMQAVDVLKDMNPGDEITANEFAGILKIDCGKESEGKQRIRTAIRHCMTNPDIRKFFAWDLKGEVLTCIPDDDLVDTHIDRQRRRAYRNGKKLLQMTACVRDTKRLTEDRRQRLGAFQIQALMTERANSTQITKKLADGNSGTFTVPDTTKLVEMMKD